MEQTKNFFVEEIFTPIRGKSKYTRIYAEQNPGVYPVYSASLKAPLCFVNDYDYDGVYLTWTTNGYGGRIQILSGKFCINGDRGILIPKIKNLPELEYFRRFLEPTLIDQAVGRVVDGKKNEYTKVSPEIVSKSIITLPINELTEIDFESITQTTNKIKKLDGIQKILLKYKEQIEEVEINIQLEGSYKNVFLGDQNFFSLSIGERVLKKESVSNGIPVYSANVNRHFAEVKKSNITNFQIPSLLWGLDGVFCWNIIPANIEFATTDHCGRLQILAGDVDPEYLYYYLQGTRLEYGFDRVFRANLDNVGELIEVKLPIDSNGKICIKTQHAYAKRYRMINEVKTKIIEKLTILSKTKIEISS